MDYNYIFTKLGYHESSHVARLAVLWPLIGKVGIEPCEQLQALQRLLGSWRLRLKELADAGYERVADHRDLQYARNCMPTMAEFDVNATPGRECNMRDFCPWCYARRLIALYSGLKKKIGIHDRLVYARSNDEEVVQDLSTNLIRSLINTHNKTLRKLVLANSKTTRGIYWMSSLSPTKEDELTLIANCSLFAAIPPEESFDFIPTHWTYEEFAIANADNLKTCVSKAFRYPTGLMHGCVDTAVAILHAREKLRLFDSCGFRKDMK